MSAIFRILLRGLPLLLAAVVHATPVFEPIQALVRGPEYPVGRLLPAADGNFYGVSSGGGAYGLGTFYRSTPSGEISRLASFGSPTLSGKYPLSLTAGPDGAFYGLTTGGGSSNYGTIFRATPDGTVITLASFSAAVGYGADLTLAADGNFYGTTSSGGASGTGFIHRFAPGASASLQVLASFPPSFGASVGGLVETSPGTFYGVTNGGSTGNGTVFKYSSAGLQTGLATLTSTTGYTVIGRMLLAPSGMLYGSCTNGAGGYGSVFQYDPATGSLSKLVSIPANTKTTLSGLAGGLSLGVDGAFYGIAAHGGSVDRGGILRVTSTGVLSISASFDYPESIGQTTSLGDLTSEGFRFTIQSLGSSYGTLCLFSSGGSFTRLATFNSPTGLRPSGIVRAADGALYGTASDGGAFNSGTLFKIAPDGIPTTLVSFNYGTLGINPYEPPYLAPDGNLYGTTSSMATYQGGAGLTTGGGTLFRLTPSGAFSIVSSFTPGRGESPTVPIQLEDGSLLGTTEDGDGGNLENGSVYRIDGGGAYTAPFTFSSSIPHSPGPISRGLDGNLYGTTSTTPTVFRLSQDGRTVTTLATLGGALGTYPTGPLAQDTAGNLYGACMNGGLALGTLYRVTPGGGVQRLYAFTDASGGHPLGGLVRGPDGNFYGTTTTYNQSPTFGSIFQLKPDGTYTTLQPFYDPLYRIGTVPTGPLLRGVDGHLYGTTEAGGTTASGEPAGGGQLFRLRFGPAVTTTAATLSATTASLAGTVHPASAPTTAVFRYGTDPTLATCTTVAATSVPTDNLPHAVTATATGLAPATTYYYQATATNTDNPDPQTGVILSFTTPPASYQAWAAANNATGPLTADDLHHGLPNLLSFAFGVTSATLPGAAASAQQPTVVHGLPNVRIPDPGTRHLVYARRKDAASTGLLYSAEFGNLTTGWTASADPGNVLAEDDEIQIVAVPFPSIGSTPPRFGRIRVTLAP